MFAKINLRLYVVLGFLFCLMATSTFGQGLVTYSDTWADTENGLAENPENNQLFIVGSAVVEIDPKSGYHSVDTQVTMTSPQGRTAVGNGSWTQKSEGTSITVEVPIEATQESEIEQGNYQSLVIHIPTCPESHPPIGGGDNYPIGVSYAKFIIEMAGPIRNCTPYGCWYERVTPCNVTCPGQPRLFHQSRPPGRLGPSVLAATPYGPYGCLIFFSLSAGGITDICYDVGWN